MFSHSFDITPDNDNDLPKKPIRALLCTVAGDVALNLEKDNDGTVRTFTLAVGDVLQGFSIRRVRLTGTTATVVGLY
jgi:hypothetical protein